MFIQDDNTYNNLREKSFLQWLDDCSKHEDIAVRGGVKLAYEYVEMLNNEIKRLKEQNELKIAIVTIDDNNGMMFNKRRQSKDIRLIERILDIAGTNRIWVSEYSSQLFDTSKDNIIVDNSYTEAQAQDYCFVENVDINELQDNISKIYVYKWNRKYPSDVTFPAAMLDNYQLENVSEFEGNSHDKITEEIYIRSKV